MYLRVATFSIEPVLGTVPVVVVTADSPEALSAERFHFGGTS